MRSARRGTTVGVALSTLFLVATTPSGDRRRDGPDGNIDLELRRDGERVLVQCKRWTSWVVGVDDIRAFAGTLMREGLSGRGGMFVTLSDFGEQARAEAKKIGLTVIDGPALYARVEEVRRVEPCRSAAHRCASTGRRKDGGSDAYTRLPRKAQPGS